MYYCTTSMTAMVVITDYICHRFSFSLQYKPMKKLFWIIPFVVILLVGVINKDTIIAKTNELIYQSPCDTPTTYRIGTIDQRFAISEAELHSDIQQAADVWNTSYGKPIFSYDPESKFTINLVYDNRQSLNTEINQINNDLEKKDSELKPQIEAYKRQSTQLGQQIDKLNQEIDSWNSQGGAPPDVYERLKSEQTKLQQEAAEINAKADALTTATQEYNNEVSTLDQKVDVYNEALSAKPEGGLYIFDGVNHKIEIFIYDSREELTHTIAHELGHSLGIDHVSPQQSIMFSRTNEIITPSHADLAALTIACEKKNVLVTKFTQFSISLRQTIESLIQRF